MHIRTRLDVTNYLCTPSLGGDRIYKVFLITEGYEENAKDLTKESLPLFMIHSTLEVSHCVFTKLQEMKDNLHSKKDINFTCNGSDTQIDRELNLGIFHDQVKGFHKKYNDILFKKIDHILQVIDIGSEAALVEHQTKRLRLRH